ncbi:MAG: bifunctional demethylmenaquinone methyltransferase/2-methoxy-6-polyprenyl-1,4-benzoquinol methylase UbiE [Flavobacteriales bacterium]|jgi:demethylmenaquinone methyltransferase/2-methoxy-6-polyprenyl-1,4-benzoquinol methylase|nr:bifunctional demethylmenaquinone methyltransferase/2-methoxy-6-polyprenyl-1,4-benzoquinol methylase UbiE [Flavobacteriales bacterium]MBK6892793.1 bifunctional demethylmenaquinone methyltransferase/2-methoxy-6-polyprenyl-1,4-benzoquinol methylase UbiE [Flavobacteriales bacterium]MBK7246937.1 bifunctional demethylmenaquinone methyltransferase/2-methoxy-6-polyprenyl-1,4-benzoquinol methylase UbiE [Flavobacteriales bacterium]MBK9061531.1 bifunctional demethylmenaquinone methyltransferase/2-methox
MTVKPYAAEGSKREQVELMFDRISPKYDLLNRLCSLGTDQGWRRKVIRGVGKEPVDRLLDVATGTADLAIMGSTVAKHVTGADISAGMLAHGRTKVEKAGLSDRIELIQADAAELPFPDASFDAITVAFGVRNFEDLARGIAGMVRVLRPGGRLFVLEFSRPQRTPFKQLFRFYFHRVMPLIGRLVSKDNAAYTYLPESVDAFPQGKAFEEVLNTCGLKEINSRLLTFGVATLYMARK